RGGEPLRFGREAELDPEHAAAAHRALHTDDATHQLYESLANDETDAGSLLDTSLAPKPVEWLKELRQLVGRQSVARVGDGDANHLCGMADKPHGHGSARPVVFDCVGQQVDDDLLEPRPVRFDVVGDV